VELLRVVDVVDDSSGGWRMRLCVDCDSKPYGRNIRAHVERGGIGTDVEFYSHSIAFGGIQHGMQGAGDGDHAHEGDGGGAERTHGQ